MSIVKSINEIAELIPEPDDRLYGSLITEANPDIVTDNPLFAFRVDNKTNVVIGMFRVTFVLTRKGEKYYLMLAHYDYEQHIGQADYLSFERPEGRKVQLSDFPFITDEIGIRVDSDKYNSNKSRIYFGTLPTDVKLLKDALTGKKESKESIVELEPTII